MFRQTTLLSLCSVLMLFVNSVATAKSQTDEDDSVYQWGRWSVLSPAAGGEEPIRSQQLVGVNDLGPGEANDLTGEVEEIENEEPTPPEPPPPEPPQPPQATGPCNDGPCGFARIDTRSNAAGADQTGTFDIALDEAGNSVEFQVNPGEAGEIASAPTAVAIGSTNFTSSRTSTPSAIRGGMTRDADTTPVVITGFWRHAEDQGEFVWGMPATGAELDALQQGNAVASYIGPIADGGQASLTLDFGQQAWNGNFTGGAVDFASNGDIEGAGIRSTGFSSNIDPANSFVEGGVVNHGDTVIGRFEVQERGTESAYSDIFRADRPVEVLPTAQ